MVRDRSLRSYALSPESKERDQDYAASGITFWVCDVRMRDVPIVSCRDLWQSSSGRIANARAMHSYTAPPKKDRETAPRLAA